MSGSARASLTSASRRAASVSASVGWSASRLSMMIQRGRSMSPASSKGRPAMISAHRRVRPTSSRPGSMRASRRHLRIWILAVMSRCLSASATMSSSVSTTTAGVAGSVLAVRPPRGPAARPRREAPAGPAARRRVAPAARPDAARRAPASLRPRPSLRSALLPPPPPLPEGGRGPPAPGCSASARRRTASSGEGRLAAWASRISTISAAPSGRLAFSVSEMPLSSICQIRDRVGTGEFRRNVGRAAALRLGQRRIVGRIRHEFQPRDEMGEIGKVGEDDGRIGAAVVLVAIVGERACDVAARRCAGTGRRCARGRRGPAWRAPSPRRLGRRHGRSPGRAATARRGPSLRRRARSSPAPRRRRLCLPSRQWRGNGRPAGRHRCAAGRSAGSATAP